MVLWFCVVARVFCLVVGGAMVFVWLLGCSVWLLGGAYGFVLLIGCSVWLLGGAMVLCCC